MASSRIPTRLVYCVDGTYCTPDGTDRGGHGNITNVYRIYASVKKEQCFDESTKTWFNQDKKYEPGIGSADEINFWEKAKAGVSGKGYKDIIRRVYKKCCTLESTDEVWLFGFSRGAYIVRAVAGLLHHIGVLQSVERDFDSVYDEVLKKYVKAENRSEVGTGQLHFFGSSQTRPPPRIQFVGVFDTVKFVDDADKYDISFNRSTQHFRHALAMNEDRRAMKPKYEFPDFSETKVSLSKRSFIQAWFVGAHIDMGGSSEKDGLALYPLQWILGESQSKGLVLGFEQSRIPWSGIDNPLRVLFPENEGDGKGHDMWTGTTKNGVCVCMQDLRKVHQLAKYQGRYSVKINSRDKSMWPRKAREIFNANNDLRGYCGWAPQGTIIHPSVYHCLDEFVMQASALSKMPDRERVETWRAKMLGTKHHILNHGFWSDGDILENDSLKAIRILVCGNCGVGKSTLINRVFGVSREDEVTETSDRRRGKHDVREPILHQSRPDLILHDSGGFEAGDESQMRAVGQFVRERSMMPRIEDRLHVIWFCLEMSSDRTQQTATEDLFKAASIYASEIPVIVILTKMDNFRGIQREQAREEFEPTTYEPSPQERVDLDKKYTEYASEQIEKRIDLVEKEMKSLDAGHVDACVAIARNDQNSIERLNQATLESVKDEKLQLLYIATQTASVNLKINTALGEVMKIYKKVLATVSTLSWAPGSSSTNRAASAISICRAIVQCFGLPTVTSQTVLEIVKRIVWDDAGHNLLIGFSEAIATLGVVVTVGFGGMPVFLAAGAFNFPLVVPATTRLMLMLASDLILILVRAFSITTTTCVGQPEEKDVAKAARDYRRISGDVHKEIFRLVPKRNVVKSFHYSKVRLGLEGIVNRFKEEVTKGLSSDQYKRAGSESFVSDSTVVGELEEMTKLFPEAKDELHNKKPQIQEIIAAKASAESSESGDESSD